MTDLLSSVIAAHGGIDRWHTVGAIDVTFNFSGGLLDLKGYPGHRNGFAEPRDRQPKSTLPRPQSATETARAAFEPAEMPANYALFVRDRETSVRIGLRGGPGRSTIWSLFQRLAVTNSR